MTLEALRAAGVDTTSTTPGVWQVAPGRSRAAPGRRTGPVQRRAVPRRRPRDRRLGAGARLAGATTQAGDALRGLLATMGADVHLGDDGLTVRGSGGIEGFDADLRDVSELTTVLAALAALASGPSTFTGLGHLRGHETDRLAALYAELTGLGGDVVEHADGLTITPRPLHGGTWHAYADHRMATAGAVLGLAVDGVVIDDIATTTKTLPDFPGMWSALLAG